MNVSVLGKTNLGFDINVITAEKNSRPTKLIMSGLHGDEIEGILLNTMVMATTQNEKIDIADFAFLTIANPDGFALHQRWNSKRVDLNRNWPSKDWSPTLTNPRYPPGPAAGSEIEIQHLCKYLVASSFKFVFDFHSYKEAMVVPSLWQPDAKLEELFKTLAHELKVPIHWTQEGMGYSIAGGLHTWLIERKIHYGVIEILRGIGQDEIWSRYLGPTMNLIKKLSRE